MSIDPIHAPGDRDRAAWDYFLQEFNQWSHERAGCPLLNQTSFVKKAHVASAYGERWQRFSAWIRTVDPNGRMLNPFFEELLSADRPARMGV